MNVNLQLDSTAEAMILKTFWLRANRGVLIQVAWKLKTSRQFVGAVYWGKRRSARVEKALRRRGAPLGATTKAKATKGR